ncbi:histidine kinase [Sorangium cellulosum]|uniref:histidine kinase n=1 Tax=Sorangium cellulosum TaxID=56 RepID=A0A150PCZ7_SORCE|nr:histidine kinase [Sorangium cellulosum]
MPTRRRFEARARVGYAILTLLLTAGMAFSVRRFSSMTDAQLAWIRSEEREITLVERLRWNCALTVANGRGYLVSGDETLLQFSEEARARFDESVRALRGQALSPTALQRVEEVEQAARDFLRVREALFEDRRQSPSEDAGPFARRIDAELVPLRRALDASLARLVEHKESAIAEDYDRARADLDRLEVRMYTLLGALVLACLGVAWYFTRLLGGSYDQVREAREAACKAVAARDELMGIVAHDLRNPLGAITLKAALLRRTSDAEKVRHHAESIEHVAQRMAHLIGTMLDVTTMEAGQFTVTPAPCAVDELLRETLDVFGPLAESRQIRLEQRVEVPDLVVHGERERVLQVLSNLLGNALKFTPQGGRVTLTVDREGTMARFTVTDTGPGIPVEHLESIFRRFWRDDVPGKRSTGLGLYIARGIIDAHGGRIWAESEVGRGARFCFTLSLAGPAGPEAPAGEIGAPSHPA